MLVVALHRLVAARADLALTRRAAPSRRSPGRRSCTSTCAAAAGPMVSDLSSGESSSCVCVITPCSSVWPKTIVKSQPEVLLRAPDELGGNDDAPDMTVRSEAEVARREVGVVEHGEQHRRHAQHDRAALGLDAARARAPGRSAAAGRTCRAAPACRSSVEHARRRCGTSASRSPRRRPRSTPEPQRDEARHVDDAAVVQQRALREARRARRVLDLRRSPGVISGSATPASPSATNASKSLNEIGLAQRGQVLARALDGGRHVVAAVARRCRRSPAAPDWRSTYSSSAAL